MRVLLNGINALSAGGRSVVGDVVACMADVAPDITFDLVLPAGQGYDHWQSERNLRVHLMRRPANRILARLADIYLNIAQWTREFQSDVCFTLGDVGPVELDIPHAVLLHQALIVYRDQTFERLWTPGERWKFRFTRWHFSRMAPRCAAITVQTPVMAERVHQMYHVPTDKLWVVHNTLPAHHRTISDPIQPDARMMSVGKPHRLLFLAAGYEHKNHVILPALVRELRRRGLADIVQIFVTLEPATRRYERDLLARLAPYTDCVTNLGRLASDQVPGAYAAANALFLPTLVESFGLIYLEAMARGCPIVTSDRDFARWMCGSLALYFDPTDTTSIADTVEQFVNEGAPAQYTERATQRLADFPTSWEPVARQYVEILRRCAT
jgi:glycosyltransferase involved in cell wall biosynthesis